MPKRRVPDQIKVGTYTLGFESVDVFAMPKETGGCFYFQPKEGHLGSIKVGLDYNDWGSVASVLLHEALEYVLLRYDLAYSPVRTFTNDTGNRLFVMDHVKFSEVCARAACFIVDVLPDLAKVYKQHKPK